MKGRRDSVLGGLSHEIIIFWRWIAAKVCNTCSLFRMQSISSARLSFVIVSQTFWTIVHDLLLEQWPPGVPLHATWMMTMMMTTMMRRNIARRWAQRKKKSKKNVQIAPLMMTFISTHQAGTCAPTVTGRIKEGQTKWQKKDLCHCVVINNLQIYMLFLFVSAAIWSLRQPFPVTVVGFFITRLRPSSSQEVWTSLEASRGAHGDKRTCAGPRSSPSPRARITGRNRSTSYRDSWTTAPACVRHSCRTSRLVRSAHTCTDAEMLFGWSLCPVFGLKPLSTSEKHSFCVSPVSTDTIIHATNSADGSVQHVAQQPVITTGSAHHAPVTPVLHPAGLATEQYPEVKTATSICIFHFV